MDGSSLGTELGSCARKSVEAKVGPEVGPLKGGPEIVMVVGLALRDVIASTDGATLGTCSEVAGGSLISRVGVDIGSFETSLLGRVIPTSVGAAVGERSAKSSIGVKL